MERNYQEIIALIEQNPDVFEFDIYGTGTSDEWIEKAQNRLQIKFPPSYVWWLKNYGSGYIYGDEVFSIYEMDSDTMSGGDIVVQNEIEKNHGYSRPDRLIFLHSDIDLGFYFDLSTINEQMEYPVFNMLTEKKYANDFLDFLKKRVLDK
ncbi:SMI1/KNR4 family protein [Hymenobacter sp. BT507]|uniref:SMI1/KNR4 family protein n=1 Tax=Hymenobacter citatus TaxID=2763506 RepID=A0ABR7MK38_9BACT|nr:SMI1/KNR4 family protein [Hymenobacter citatus]MBC6611430.1 SMI1/KNR4 family protein [Hymenobacter citatus]